MCDCKGEISEEIPQTTVWKDPETGETFIVDARSGNSYSQNSRHKVSETNTASMNRVTRTPRHVLKNNRDPGQGGASSGPTRDSMPDWLSEALSVGPWMFEIEHHLTLQFLRRTRHLLSQNQKYLHFRSVQINLPTIKTVLKFSSIIIHVAPTLLGHISSQTRNALGSDSRKQTY